MNKKTIEEIKKEYDTTNRLIKNMLMESNDIDVKLYCFMCGIREGLSKILSKEDK